MSSADQSLSATTAALGVESSVSGRFWQLAAGDDRLALTLQQRFGVGDIAARVMASRGIGPDEAPDFLQPQMRALMPDPDCLRGMPVAAKRIADAVQASERIVIFGDYDVDGATSAAQLVLYLRAIGLDAGTYIPNRLTEGYGPSVAALTALKQQGADLCIMVDCGTTAFEPLEAAAEAGLDVVIIDHHLAEARLPPCAALVNPNQIDDTSGLGHLAACGLVFMTLVAVNRLLRARGHFTDGRTEPKLLELLDLVALGTVADVVGLTGLNRAFVTQGLKQMNRTQNRGLLALAEVAGVNEIFSAYHLGFVLGPRINAGGRLGRSDLGVALLTAENGNAAHDAARELHALNADRKAIETDILEAAKAQAVQQVSKGARAIIAVGDDWHAGVTGIVAARLREQTGLPAFAVAMENGTGKGSGRSRTGIDLGSLVLKARQTGVISGGGGHAMAAGITAITEELSAFRDFLNTELAGIDLGPDRLTIDAVLGGSGNDTDILADIGRLAPFGSGNPEPRVAVTGLRVGFADIVGGDHVRCRFTDAAGRQLEAIAFRAAAEPLGDLLMNSNGRALHVAGKLKRDNWKSANRGRDVVQLIIDDAAPAG